MSEPLTLKRTETGDIDISAGTALTGDLKEYVAVKAADVLRLFLGEWFLDRRIGINYFRDVLVKNPDFRLMRSTFTRALLKVPGIKSIDDMTFALDKDRQLFVAWKATLVNGDTFATPEPIILEG